MRRMPGSAALARLFHRVAELGWGGGVTLLALAVCAGGLWAFVALTGEMLEGDVHGFDETLLLALREPADPARPIGPFWLTAAFRDLTALGGYTVVALIGLVAGGYLVLVRRPFSALFILAVFAGGLLLEHGLKLGFGRTRPDLVAHLVDVATASYPSGHAMVSAVVYLTIGAMLAEAQRERRAKIYVVAAAVLLVILVGLSRVWLGVHWPSDVLAGWSIGAAFAMAAWLGVRWLRRRGRPDPR